MYIIDKVHFEGSSTLSSRMINDLRAINELHHQFSWVKSHSLNSFVRLSLFIRLIRIPRKIGCRMISEWIHRGWRELSPDYILCTLIYHWHYTQSRITRPKGRNWIYLWTSPSRSPAGHLHKSILWRRAAVLTDPKRRNRRQRETKNYAKSNLIAEINRKFARQEIVWLILMTMEARAKNSSFIHHSVIISRLAFHNELPFLRSDWNKTFLQFPFALKRRRESEK